MRKIVAGLILFGIPFGYLQATIASYIRSAYVTAHERYHGPAVAQAGVFPLLTIQQLSEAGVIHLLAIEIGREAMSLGMIGAAAFTAGRTYRESVAAFAVGFGIWQIAFYAFLNLLTGWPQSLLDWDLLFLIPAPWTAPILAPLLLSLALIWCGVHFIQREWSPIPIRIRVKDRRLLMASGVVVALAFLSQAANAASGQAPGGFLWPLLAAGLALGVGTFSVAARR
ncbi:MAG: hypothetical protein SFV54_10050 [Bryobacteraceae bacterium]|nr:hypothetical protein [Bryobacteraceae bacterium]